MGRIGKILLVVIILLVVMVLVGPFLVPIPALEDTVPPEQLADPDSRFAEVNGLRVHYKTAGQGEPVLVLLHGFASSIYTWREVMEPLAGDATVVAFDRPAFGLTERPMPGEWDGDNPYTPEAQTDLVVGLLDELGLEKAVLVGNSAGGTVAVYTALQHPERVSGLVLVDAAIYSGGGAPDWIKPLLRTPQMRRLGPLVARSIGAMGDNLANMAWHDPSKLTPEAAEGYRKPLRVENWDRALWEFTLASRDLGLADRLDEIGVPVLVVTGDDDRIVPTEESIRLAGELPDAGLAVIAACGHVPQEECPAEFLDAVRGFLADL